MTPLLFLLLFAPVDPPKESARDLLVGQWRLSQGESWSILEFMRDGTYRRREHHDGAGGAVGTESEKGTYRVLDETTVELKREGKPVKKMKITVTKDSLKIDREQWRRF